mgnify:CR=1|jgi:hypothetical protein
MSPAFLRDGLRMFFSLTRPEPEGLARLRTSGPFLLPFQFRHGFFDAAECQRVHPVTQKLTD